MAPAQRLQTSLHPSIRGDMQPLLLHEGQNNFLDLSWEQFSAGRPAGGRWALLHVSCFDSTCTASPCSWRWFWDLAANPFELLLHLKTEEKSGCMQRLEGSGGKMLQSRAADGSSPSFQDPGRLCQIGTGAGESRKWAVGPSGSRRPLTSWRGENGKTWQRKKEKTCIM